MKRLVFLFAALFAISGAYGQDSAASILRLDNAVKSVAQDLNGRIAAEQGGKVVITQFVYRNNIPQLGAYWATQLVEELTNIPNRSYIVLVGDSADLIVSGEIVEIAGTMRIYTRLVRSSDRSIVANFHSDVERDDFIIGMLDGGESGGSSSVFRDLHEPDSFENPQTIEISTVGEGPVVNRTIHASGDEDFFLLEPARDGSLTLETTGSMDTVMELYDAVSRNSLSENDDGGSGNNARIRYTVRAGTRYIAKVRGYSSATGNYGFRASIIEQAQILPDEFEEDNSFSTAKDIQPGTPQQHNFSSGDDVDWVKFQATRAGVYVIRTRGVNSNRLDTYIELYDANQNLIDENDDGGESLDSRLSVRLESGTYYLKVECLGDEPDQPYTISITAE
jgi:hypothetical protein